MIISENGAVPTKIFTFLRERISWRGFHSSTSLTKLYSTGLALFPVNQIMRRFQTSNLRDRDRREHINRGGGRDRADLDRVTPHLCINQLRLGSAVRSRGNRRSNAGEKQYHNTRKRMTFVNTTTIAYEQKSAGAP